MIRIRVAVAWLAAAVALGGCGCCCGGFGPIGPAPDLTVADVAGTYRGPGEAVVVLGADGRFTAEHLHDCGTTHFGDLEGPSSGRGSGTWNLDEPVRLYPYQSLDLHFGPPENYGWYGWLADEEEISFFKGDPDAWDRCVFAKG